MTRATTKMRGPKALLAGAVALAAVAMACESPTPTAEGPDAERETAPTSISEDVESAESADELPPPSEGGEASDRPAFIPYEVPPKLSNPEEVREHLQEAYSEDLREDGVEGRVVLWMYVDAEGQVERVRVQHSSGLDALDEAAKQVGLNMEFKPAMNQDRPTAVWVQQPITFETE